MNIDEILSKATEKIGENYFQLPIDGKENPIYRERVYCYELYHQMRLLWPEDTKYELSGEVDKSGHPLIRGNNLDNAKPDFLVHIPGDIAGNHTIIEVKPINADKQGIEKDLKTLTAFRQQARYQKAIYLFYGNNEHKLRTLFTKIHEISAMTEEINLTLIELWLHSSIGSAAQPQQNQ